MNSLRQRLRGDKGEKGEGAIPIPAQPPPPSDAACAPSSASSSPVEETYEFLGPGAGGGRPMSSSSPSPLASPVRHRSKTSSPSHPRKEAKASLGEEERAVFEQQLIQLQEQIVAVVIENQELKAELKELQAEESRQRLQQLLEYERQRSHVLEERVKQLEKAKADRSVQRSHSDASVRRMAGARARAVEAAEEALPEPDSSRDSQAVVPKPKQRRFDRWWEVVVKAIYDLMDDLSEEAPQQKEEDPEGDQLSPKILKDNIKRFGTAAKPYYATARGLYNLLTWQTPSYTLIVFCVYMWAMWKGWFLPLLLLCLNLRLFINYLNSKGFTIDFNFLDSGEEEKEAEDKDLGVTDKFALVVQVARKVQNTLGAWADSLEKIKNLLLWRHPKATRQLMFMLLLAMLSAIVFEGQIPFYLAGLYMGVKLFIIDYFFNRFPRLKRKYDSVYQMWQELPTDVQYEKRHMLSEIDRCILPHDDRQSEASAESSAEPLSEEDRSFCQLFSLPSSECPLPGWQGGRRCTLINRDKNLTGAFKNGKLYLTRSFLCFERTKAPSPKNLVIPLSDITRLEKAKPYSWMPGGGMAIEVAVTYSDKTLVFGGLLNRDDCYADIWEEGLRNQLPWATGNAENITPTMRRRIREQQFSNFSLFPSETKT